MNRFLGFALAIVIIVALIAGLSYFASQNSSQFVASTNTNTTCVFCGFSSTLVQNNTTSSASGKKSVSSNTTFVNTFFTTSCVISGVGGFEFRLVSDSTGQPVNASTISAVDKLGCNQENQVVYLDNFSYSGDGWFTPVFPSQATVGGGLNLTVGYEGKTYNFLGDYPPVGTDCVTLSVPSGNVSSTTVMNGSGSYCSAITTSSVTYSSTSSMSFSNSSNNKLGLELLASVNSTDLSQKDSSLLLNITVLNTLATQNNVSYANSWAIANMTHFGGLQLSFTDWLHSV